MLYYYKATLKRVIDGDTIDALVDLGFHTSRKVRIRLLGIDTAETRTKDLEEKKKGLEAKAKMFSIMEENNGEFEMQSTEVDSFGRALAYIFVDRIDGELKEEKVNVNQYFLENKLAPEYVRGK